MDGVCVPLCVGVAPDVSDAVGGGEPLGLRLAGGVRLSDAVGDALSDGVGECVLVTDAVTEAVSELVGDCVGESELVGDGLGVCDGDGDDVPVWLGLDDICAQEPAGHSCARLAPEHAVGAAARSGQKNPTGHCVAAELPLGQYVPQEHAVATPPVQTLPAGHDDADDWPPGHSCPALQRRQ